MLFFKPKQKADDFLPPPPPPDLEEPEPASSQFTEKPKFFDEIVKPKKAAQLPEEEEFSDLVKGMGKLKQKGVLSKKVKITAKSAKPMKAKAFLFQKNQKISAKPKSDQQKKIRVQQLKEKAAKTLKQDLEEDFGLKDIDFGLPEIEPRKDIELPDTLDDFDADELGKELGQNTENPGEISEAREEIQSAIEKIKKNERPSFFSKLFAKGKKEEKLKEIHQTSAIQNRNGVSVIQSNLKKARDALMTFDLETAKRNYIEIMKAYNNLAPGDKAKVYHDINELYSERKSAEELKL